MLGVAVSWSSRSREGPGKQTGEVSRRSGVTEEQIRYAVQQAEAESPVAELFSKHGVA